MQNVLIHYALISMNHCRWWFMEIRA